MFTDAHLLLQRAQLVREVGHLGPQLRALFLRAAAFLGDLLQLHGKQSTKLENGAWREQRRRGGGSEPLTESSVCSSFSETSLSWSSFWLRDSPRLEMSSSFCDVLAKVFSLSRRELSRLS